MSDLFGRFQRILRGLSSGLGDVDPDEVLRAWREARARRQGADGPGPHGWDETRARARRHAASTGGGLAPEIQRAYANLELTPPATLDEAKAAWRSMMRKYHPDKHQDPGKAEVATKLAARLTEAYQIVREHLDG